MQFFKRECEVEGGLAEHGEDSVGDIYLRWIPVLA